MITTEEWRPRARALAELLERRGDLRDPAWKAAVAETPRHLLVPEAYEQDSTAKWHRLDMDSAEGLERVYSPTTLVTSLAQRGSYLESVSSSTKPDLMLRMLETLDVHSGQKVLEIGTGSGYNAALLAHRLGDANVYSVDVDPDLVAAARRRLASIGRHLTLTARDGALGFAEHAPYDRSIATCSVPSVPRAWQEQLRDEGLLLADIKLGTSAGNLVLLRKRGDILEGHFTQRWAGFMSLRRSMTPETPAQRAPKAESSDARTRSTGVPPTPWESHRVVWFLAHLCGLPTGVRSGFRLDAETGQPAISTLTGADGSQAAVSLETTSDGTWSVTESGPTPLWTYVEEGHRQWQAAGEPDWPRLGLTVTRTDQRVWIDRPDSEHQWNLVGVLS